MSAVPASSRLSELLQAHLAGGGEGTVLRERPDGAVIRLREPSANGAGPGRTVIAKVWTRTGVKDLLRRVTQTSPMHREELALRRLVDQGVRVPRVLGGTRLGGRYTQALFVEDLGECRQAMEVLKERIAAGQDTSKLEGDIIELTAQILKAGVVDPDHSLLNVLVLPSGAVARVDFEIARCVPTLDRAHDAYGATLARLLNFYTFAVQPDVARAEAFAARMAERIKPPPAVLSIVRREVEAQMERQRRASGIDTRLALSW